MLKYLYCLEETKERTRVVKEEVSAKFARWQSMAVPYEVVAPLSMGSLY